MEDNLQEREGRLLLVPQKDLVVFPGMMSHLDMVGNQDGERLKRLFRAQGKALLLLQRDPLADAPMETEAYYDYGTLVEIKQIAKLPNGQLRILIFGLEREEVKNIIAEGDVLYAEVSPAPIEQVTISRVESEALARALHDLIVRFCEVHGKLPKEMVNELASIREMGLLMRQAMFLLPIPMVLRQSILEAQNNLDQYQTLSGILANEVEILRIRAEVKAKVQQSLEKNQKDYVLREQMKIIREELGEGGPAEDGVRFMEAVDALNASEEIKDAIRREARRYLSMSGNNAEALIVRNYVETLLSLPWDTVSEDNTDIRRAERILARDHYGLTEVKERIREYLAVRMYAKNPETPILCLVGPPGTGKTSIAKSIAEAMNRNYVRVCLGGVRDEAEIRGHRRTYLASMPGRIVQGLRQAKTSNPLMLLDEIDKLGNDYKGDPASALLEVLDSAQNNRFVDHYIELPVDLSRVVFLATANDRNTIPKPLLDRMEIIEINSYTMNEKCHIAKEHLIPKQRRLHGLSASDVVFSEAAIKELIASYTKEAGVRGLERMLGKVCRKVVLSLAENAKGTGRGRTSITGRNLQEYLGRPKYRTERKESHAQIGVVRGLAWTSVGGTTLEIEVNVLPGSGKLQLTGSMGDVMKESAKTGISYVRSVADEYDIPKSFFEEHDIHIHIPEGAVPKDGPSAGITIATAVLSAVTGIPASANVAMTGEITLRGRVLPIGGLKEKLLAAKSIGITDVVLPEGNREELVELPEEIIGGMELHPVSTMSDVLAITLVR